MSRDRAARLPVRLSSLVGRDRERAGIAAALREARLLTLTGPGGTGKTRLALATAQAASSAGEPFSGGVFWTDLAPVDDPAAAAAAVAGQLGVPESPDTELFPATAEHLGDRPVLVVLDNCEHLTAAVAELAAGLLAACPALSILATSREMLGVDGEQAWPVPPLAVPPTTGPPAAGPPATGPPAAAPGTAAGLAGYDAALLFEQRARQVRPGFEITDENAAAVAHICARLDGLPLAIELAAARMRILSAGQLAARLDDVFGMLTGGARTAPRRHQALRATLDWSHDLLDEQERAVLRRLAVFAGGCTLPAAEQVAAGTDIEAGRMVEVLARLADKSLLRVEHAGDVRYHLLSVVRDYARERLVAAGELDAVRHAHLEWLTGLAEEIEPRLAAAPGGPGQVDYDLGRLDAETDNLRAALEFARDSGEAARSSTETARNSTETARSSAVAVCGLRLAAALPRYAYLRGHYLQVGHWLDAAFAAAPGAPAPLRARALAGSGRLALLHCDYQAAVRRLEAALAAYTGLGDAAGIAAALQGLGGVAREQGQYPRSVELHEQALERAREAGDGAAVAAAHGYLALTSWLRRDFDRARAEAATALPGCRELGDQAGIAWALIILGAVARHQDEPERAAELLGQAQQLAGQIGFREGLAWCGEQLGLLAADRGDPAAAELLRASLELHRELRDRWRTTSLLDDLAALQLGRGHADQAARLLAAAEAMRRAIGTVVPPCESARHGQTLAGARAALGDRAFDTAWRQGLRAAVRDLQAELANACPDRPDGPDVPGGPAARSGPAAAAPGVTTANPAGPAPAGVTAVNPVPRPAVAATAVHQTAAGAPAERAGGRVSGRLRIRVLGQASVRRGETELTAADWGYAKPRELFFLLIASGPQTREQLGAALWPDQAAGQLGNALHTALREVRKALGDPGWIRYAGGRYAFDAGREHDSDIGTFEQALRAARAARPAAAALPDLQRAIAAYGGDFLAGMAAGGWAEDCRNELRRAYESALVAAGRLHAAAGRHQAAVTAFRRAVAHEPLNETAHRELMASWARLGESARALAHYDELAAMLRGQLGVEPAAETTALARRLRAKP